MFVDGLNFTKNKCLDLEQSQATDFLTYINSQAFREAFHTYKDAGFYYPISPDINIVTKKFKVLAEGSWWIYDIFAKYPEKYRMLQI